jgi:serine/threonine-protein kinase
MRRALSGDLDTIVLKAMAKEPTRRYHSVEQFADDLRRHLAGEPVLARPDGFRYRALKFVGRHRVGALAAAVVVLSLAGGFIAASWQATVASRERVRAQTAQQRTEGVAEFVIDLFSGDDASVDVEATTAMLDYGVRRAEDLDEQPEVQAETFEALARAYYNLARYQEAADLHTRAYEVRVGVSPEGSAEVARSLTRMSDAVARLGLNDSTDQLLARAWAIEQQLGAEANRARLETLTEMGRVARGRARLEESDSILQVALTISDRALEPYDPLRVGILHQLVMTSRARENFTEAEHLQRETLTLQRRRLGPAHPELAYERFFLGDLLVDGREDFARAEAHYREGIRIVEEALGPESKRLVHGINSLASVLVRTNREREAVAVMRRGVRIVEGAYGVDNIATARERETLAGVLLDAGHVNEAESVLLDVLDHKQRLLGEWTVPGIHLSLSRIAERRGDMEQAAWHASEALRIQRESGAPPSTIAGTLDRVADVQARQRNSAEAGATFARGEAPSPSTHSP